MIVILDLAGLGMSHVGSTFTGLLKTYIGKFMNLYPESLYKLYVINAPFIFSGVWSAISVFVHPITRAKIHILSNPKYALEDLSKIGAKLEYKLDEVCAHSSRSDHLAALAATGAQEGRRGTMPCHTVHTRASAARGPEPHLTCVPTPAAASRPSVSHRPIPRHRR
jgi:hypothetical protein